MSYDSKIWYAPIDYILTDKLNYKQKIREKISLIRDLINYLEVDIPEFHPEVTKQLSYTLRLRAAKRSLKTFESQASYYAA